MRGKKGELKNIFNQILSEGFVRVKVDKEEYNLPKKIKLEKNKKHNVYVIIDRLIINKNIIERLTSSIELALKMGNGLVIIEHKDKEYIYSENYSCSKCDLSFEELQPRAFSFNSPFGACKNCSGLGTEMSIDPDLIIPDKRKNLLQGCIIPIGEQPKGNWYSSILKSLSIQYQFSFTTP